MNPVNRLKPVEFGGVFTSPKVDTILKGVTSQIDDLSKTSPVAARIFPTIKRNLEGLKGQYRVETKTVFKEVTRNLEVI